MLTAPDVPDEVEDLTQLNCYVYSYDDGEWHVPEGFEFPRNVKLENGFNLWVYGMPSHQIKGPDGKLLEAPIRPFRYLELKYLPKKANSKFKLQWVRIFQMMEEAVVLPMVPTALQVKEAFGLGMMHLQTRMGYVFGGSKQPNNWEVLTWCKHAARSFIEKHGTDQDRMNLPPPNKKNNTRRQPIKRNRPEMDERRRKVPKKNRAATQQQEQENSEEEE